ncbi:MULTISPECIES: DUF6488 family protein [Shewanella]|jgi:hypothetical protein|uniref:DUF6488 family protein n=1 Tax=Shewanella TaxID=22 RepID=UPI003AB09708
MRYLFSFIVIVISFNCNYSFAHPDRMKSMIHTRHSHLNEEKITNIVIKKIHKMILEDFGYDAGKLKFSWGTIKNEDVNIISVNDGVYVVSATNSHDNKTLYFRVDKYGDVIAVAEHNLF